MVHKGFTYHGSLKHKQWKPDGGFGSLCPNWTHQAGRRGFAGNPHTYPWPATVAQDLLSNSVADQQTRQRYAARRGIAFVAQMSNDGSWHGYPVPWDDVPSNIQDTLISSGQATARDMRRQKSIDTKGIRWALKSDED